MEAPPFRVCCEDANPCDEVTRHVSNQRLSLRLGWGELARRLRVRWLDAAAVADY